MIDVQLIGGGVLALAGLLIGIIGPDPLFQWVIDESRWKQLLIYGPLMWLIAGLAVAMLLAWKGTTPGKLLFGLRVRSANDLPVTLNRAVSREASLFVSGIGLGLPLLSLIAAITSYSQVDKGQRPAWDERTDMIVEGKRITGWLRARMIVGFVIIVILLGWGAIERLV